MAHNPEMCGGRAAPARRCPDDRSCALQGRPAPRGGSFPRAGLRALLRTPGVCSKAHPGIRRLHGRPVWPRGPVQDKFCYFSALISMFSEA